MLNSIHSLHFAIRFATMKADNGIIKLVIEARIGLRRLRIRNRGCRYFQFASKNLFEIYFIFEAQTNLNKLFERKRKNFCRNFYLHVAQ